MEIRLLNEPQLPRIVFKAEAFKKMLALLNPKTTSSNEVAWLGTVEKRSDLEYYIKDIHIPPQEKNTKSWVETADEMALWLAQQFTTLEDRKSIRFHGHSHPKFGTTPSGTDEGLMAQLKRTVSDYFIRIIVNEKYEFNCDIFSYALNLEVRKMEVEIELDENIHIASTGNGKYYPIIPENGEPEMTFIQQSQAMKYSSESNHVIQSIIGGPAKVISPHFIVSNEKLTLNNAEPEIKLMADDLKSKLITPKYTVVSKGKSTTTTSKSTTKDTVTATGSKQTPSTKGSENESKDLFSDEDKEKLANAFLNDEELEEIDDVDKAYYKENYPGVSLADAMFLDELSLQGYEIGKDLGRWYYKYQNIKIFIDESDERDVV